MMYRKKFGMLLSLGTYLQEVTNLFVVSTFESKKTKLIMDRYCSCVDGSGEASKERAWELGIGISASEVPGG